MLTVFPNKLSKLLAMSFKVDVYITRYLADSSE
jgi:hypothetical protein